MWLVRQRWSPELADHFPVVLLIFTQGHLDLGAVCHLQGLSIPKPGHLGGLPMNQKLTLKGPREFPGTSDVPWAPHKGVLLNV